MTNIVVARYRENVDWLNKIDPSFQVFLYNKGEPLNPTMFKSRNIKIIDIKNVGRETDTYFHHIENTSFEDNQDYTVFTQGDPFEHSPQFLEILNSKSEWTEVQPLSMQWIEKQNVPPRLIIADERQDWTPSGKIIRRERFALKTWAPISFFDQGAWNIGVEYKQRHYLPDGTNIAHHFFDLIGLHEYAASCKDAEIGLFSYGGIFAVSNYRIKAFKEQIGDRIHNIRLIAKADKNYGYIYERLWLHLFGEEFMTFKF